MSFRYTRVGALLNEDKFQDAADYLVDKLVAQEVDAAKEEGRPVQVRTNKAAVIRDKELGADYRTFSRWIANLRERGLDVIKIAETRLEKIVKEQVQKVPTTQA